jgi:uncharacterized protein
MRAHSVLLTLLLLGASTGIGVGGAEAAEGPSFDCAKAISSAEKAVCASPGLSALDRVLSEVYGRAKAAPGAPASLAAEQRGWIKGRDDCWKTGDVAECVKDDYVTRIAELVTLIPAAARGAPVVGPIPTTCDGIADRIEAVFVNTEPGYLTLGWGDMRVVLDQAISASGARFTAELDGGKYEFWEKGNEASFMAPALLEPAHCVLRE